MTLTLSSLFSDNMVLQQGMPLKIWGTATPKSHIAVTFGPNAAEATADADGKWQANLPAVEACAIPSELRATSGQETVTLRNVLVGEVWICSGQSNMEWTVKLSRDADKEVADANHPEIRLFTVPKRIASEPYAGSLKSHWMVCSPETIVDSSIEGFPTGFSAVAYFFGRELQRRLNIPIGLIHSSWGGTPAESWVSREGLLSDASISELWTNFERMLPELLPLQEAYEKEFAAMQERTRDSKNAGYDLGYAAVDDPSGDWRTMTLPANWFTQGLDFNGIVWFRKVVDVPKEWAGKDLRLGIGAVDKSDTTYFNGEFVGSVTMQDRLDAWNFPRVYTVPGKLVKAGRNVIAVRAHSDIYDGGMIGPAANMRLSCPADPDTPSLLLDGDWRYAVEANYGRTEIPVRPPGPGNANTPASLYNGMIHPLLPFALRGAIWYQGESNVGRAAQYSHLLKALIQDWRKNFELPELAFYIVQLANFRERNSETGWAELREAQESALALPNTGMAVAIDIGEALDIHPRNKQDVGRRLAYSALNKTYGLNDVVPSGPAFKRLGKEGRALRVHFDHTDGGLHARGGELHGFEVAAADGTYRWAEARIDGDSVVVRSADVPEPVACRYAWNDNPDCNLYNGADLPAAPFRREG